MDKLAQAPDFNTINQGLEGFKFKDASIGQIVTAILPYIFFVAGVALLLFFIFAGYRMMFSGGDPKAMADAKSKMTYAVIGFVIVFMAYWIAGFIGQFLGLSDFNTMFGGLNSAPSAPVSCYSFCSSGQRCVTTTCQCGSGSSATTIPQGLICP